MRLSLFSASSLLFLVGCFDVVTVLPPEPAPEVIRLESGSYGLVVTDVLAADCSGMDEDELFGLLLSMELSMGRGDGARADLQGIPLSGGMAHGVLELDGELVTYEETEPVEPCEDPDDRDDGDDDREPDSDEDVETTESEGGEVVETETEDYPDEPVDCGDSDSSEPRRHGDKGRKGEVSLDIVASRPDHGEGVLSFVDRICSFELAIEVQAIEHDDEVIHYEEEPECGEDVDEDASDCG